VHGHNELPTWFAHVALQFISEGSSLPIIHLITEFFDSWIHIRFGGDFELPIKTLTRGSDIVPVILGMMLHGVRLSDVSG
jgi:hypothetical protein